MPTIPDSHKNRLQFFTDLLATITTNAAALGWDAARLAAVTTTVQPVIDTYQVLVDAEDAALEAGSDANTIFNSRKPAVQVIIDELRSSSKCSGAMLAAMKLTSSTVVHDPATIKPRIKAKADMGEVHITGSKDYAEVVNIYMRRAGQIAWIKVGYQRKKFPFNDQTPLLVAALPEVREYMARGVINDVEIGLESDIVQVAYAG